MWVKAASLPTRPPSKQRWATWWPSWPSMGLSTACRSPPRLPVVMGMWKPWQYSERAEYFPSHGVIPAAQGELSDFFVVKPDCAIASSLATVADEVVGQHTGHHRFADRYGADTDAGVVA